MRNLIAVVSLAALTLTACGSSNHSQAQDKDFLKLAHVAYPNAKDALLMKAGHANCAALKSSQSWDALIAANHVTGDAAAASTALLLTASISVYCPSLKKLAPAGTFTT